MNDKIIQQDIPDPWATWGDPSALPMTRRNPSGSFELRTCHRCPNEGHCGDCAHLSAAVQRLGMLEEEKQL